MSSALCLLPVVGVILPLFVNGKWSALRARLALKTLSSASYSHTHTPMAELHSCTVTVHTSVFVCFLPAVLLLFLVFH